MGLLRGSGSLPATPTAADARLALTPRGLLAERARDGDRDAFEALLDRWLEPSLRTAYAIIGNETDARDATQDAFLQAWRELPRLRDPERFDAWLSRILVNRCRTLRSSRRRAAIREIHLGDLPEPAEPVTGDDPQHESGSLTLDAIEYAMGRLSGAEPDDPRPPPPPAPPADRHRGWAGHSRGHREVAPVRRSKGPRTGYRGGPPMITNVPLTDAIIEAALARCAARVDSTGLRDEIMAGIATTPQSRGPFVGWSAWATWPATSLRLAWLLLVMVLLLALAGGLLIVGSSPRTLLRDPQALVAPGIEVLAPGPLEPASVVVGFDGMVWAYTRGHLVRLDPTSGDTRTWTVADDVAFAGPGLATSPGGRGLAGRSTRAALVRRRAFPRCRLCSLRRGLSVVRHRVPDGTLWVSAAERGVLRWDGEHGRVSPPSGPTSLPAPSPLTRAVTPGSPG